MAVGVSCGCSPSGGCSGLWSGGCCSGCFWGCCRYPFHHRKFVVWREMGIPGGHGDCLVSCEFLNLFDRRPCHCQPRAECVPVGVPDISGNPLAHGTGWRFACALAAAFCFITKTGHLSASMRTCNLDSLRGLRIGGMRRRGRVGGRFRSNSNSHCPQGHLLADYYGIERFRNLETDSGACCGLRFGAATERENASWRSYFLCERGRRHHIRLLLG